MLNSLFSKRILVGFLGAGAIMTLGACNEPTDTAGESTYGDETAEDATPQETAADDETAGDEMADTAGETIVDVAAGSESFGTLVEAVQAAGLAETLSQEGPYTVFAPTDEAFQALPEGTLEQLLQPENQETLVQVLSYHVLPQEVPADQVTAGAVDTLAGAPADISVDGSSIMVNDATVVQPNIEASNGVIHAIDTVILPPDVQL